MISTGLLQAASCAAPVRRGERRSRALRSVRALCVAQPQGGAGASQGRPEGPVKLWDIAAKKKTSSSVAVSPPSAPPLPEWALPVGAAVGVAAVAGAGRMIFDRPSRPYEPGSVGREYDAWTTEGILEYYWGEHIHLGYYTDEERKAGYKKKDFKQAKFDFTDRMLEFSLADKPATVLDVGCGIGGTTRYLAKKFGPETQLTGITLSPKQVERGTKLAAERGLGNVQFKVMDALKMDFLDNSFDLVWACESGEHMPDKKKYVEEMVRVLKPGGRLVIATWCQRDASEENPLSARDKADLQFLYEEWSHPYFISYNDYKALAAGTGAMEQLEAQDWAVETLPSWRHSVWVGAWDPWIVVSKPLLYYKVLRDWYCLERMHRAFTRGLMTYGMIRGRKAIAAPPPSNEFPWSAWPRMMFNAETKEAVPKI